MYNLCRVYYEALSKLSVCRYIAMQETGTVYSRLGKYFQGFYFDFSFVDELYQYLCCSMASDMNSTQLCEIV